MKKLISVALVLMMICAMAITAASAEGVTQNTAATIQDQNTTINIHKYDPDMITVGNDGTISPKTVEQGETSEQALAKAGVKGAKFTAYQVLAYDVDTQTYSVTENFTGIEVKDIIKATDTTYTSYGTTTELEKQIAKMQGMVPDATTANGAIIVSDETTAAGVTSIAVKPGVYLVMETQVPDNYIVTTQAFLVSAPVFNGETDRWDYTIDALPKNQKIDIDKSVDSAKTDNTTNDSSDAKSVGDIVDYTITVAVPDYGTSTNYPNYRVTDAMFKYDTENDFGKTRFNALDMEFTDTLSKGLTFLPDSLEVKVGATPTTLTLGDTLKTATAIDTDTDLTPVHNVTYTTTGNGDYTLTTEDKGNGVTEVKVDVAWAALNAYQGQTITLTYKAQINDQAVAGTASNNTIKVEFVNDPTNKTQEASDPDKDDDTDTNNDIFTYQMDVTKLFDKATTTTLGSAVEFTMSVKGDSSNTPVLFTKNADGSYTVWTGRVYNGKAVPATFDGTADGNLQAGDIATFKELTANISPAADGQLHVNGMKDVTYILTETKTADGYSILTAPLTIEITEKKGDGNKVLPEVTATVDGNAVDANYTVTTGTEDNTTTTKYDGHFRFEVNNPKAKFFSLPTTGGLGLWMFTIGGGILMAGAIIFISVLRKKRNAA